MDYESIVNALIGPPDNSPPKTMADALYAAAPAAYQSPQDFASANTGIGDQVRNQLRQYLGGFDAMRPKTASDLGEMALYSTPGLGNALSARDAYNAGSSGDWRGAALGAIGAVPFFGGMTHMADEAAAKGIRAYHGSPHDFDQFDLSKIGTGEGAQAFGHGLYFADNEGVAKSYRDTLSRNLFTDEAGNTVHGLDMYETIIGALRKGHPDIDSGSANVIAVRMEGALKTGASMQEAFDSVRNSEQLGKRFRTPEGRAALDQGLKTASEKLMQYRNNPGRMYEVNINADPEHFLDWDKPFSQQSETVKNALAQHGLSPEAYTGQNPPGRNLYEDLGYSKAANGDRRVAATDLLSQAGVPGIKYLDQGSRAAGEGSRNYVVFDDKLISIVKKYGIPGAIGLGIISPEMGRQMQEQGI